MSTHAQFTFILLFNKFMATHRTDFPVEKPYLKVDRRIKSRNSSSSGKINLSYSYSCVRAFEENQYIIGELAAAHHKAQFKGLSHEPTLFTLTGDREKPICQPFYFSTLSEHNSSSNKHHNTNKSSTDASQQFTNSINEPVFTRQLYNQNRSYREDIVRDYQSAYEPELPDLQVLVQWLKYQFKYINYLWPFSKTNCKFITNLCKRNRKMKMEMLLNNFDEGTKSTLKQYVADMNLNMEERFSLCNESIIEIDISPIVEYPERLQSFLLFLRSVELRNSTEVDNVDKKDVETKKLIENQTEVKKSIFSKHMIEHTGLFKNINVSDNLYNNVHIKSNNKQPNNIFNQAVPENYRERSVEKYCKPLFIDKFGSGTCKNDSKSYNNKLIGKNENEIGNYTYNFEDSTTQNEGRQTQNKYAIDNNLLQGELPDKKTRMSLTFPDPKLKIENKRITLHSTNVKNSDNNPSMFRTNRVSRDHSHENHASLPESNWSCKCLMHENREDYMRYKNQCLFGKGDENSNRFLKYVMNNSKCETDVNDHSRGSEHAQKQVAEVDDYPSVTKLVSNDKNKTESETKPRIINLKYAPHKSELHKCIAKNKTLSYGRSSKHESGNKELQTKSLTSPMQNDSGKELSYNGRKPVAENKENLVEHFKCCEEDIEKLVCAVNLSKQYVAGDNLNVIDKQDAINACFESLDYSVNSFSTNNEENTSLKQPIPNSSSKKPINVSSKMPHGSSIPSICSTHLTENNKDANTFEVNRIIKSGHGSLEKNEYVFEIIPYKYCDERSNNTEPKDYNNNVSLNTNGKNKSKQIKFSENQVHVLIKNANEVEKDITLLNERISQLNTRKEDLDCTHGKMYISDKSESHKQKKRSLLIRLNSGDTQQTTEPSHACVNKKHLNLNPLNPRNIYRSISSIFKGNRTKYKQDCRSMNNKSSSLECYKSLSKGNSHDGRTEIAFNRDFKESLTPRSSNVLEDNSQLLIRCLEKLYEQLERQQKEIQLMKKLLDNYTNESFVKIN